MMTGRAARALAGSLLGLMSAGLAWLPSEASEDRNRQAARLLQISQVWGFQWAPDGQRIAYLSDESGTSQVHLFSVADGASRQLTRHAHPVWDPQWSPDGQRLLFLSDPGWQERNELWEVNVQNGTSRRLLADGAAILRNARWSPDGSAILLETNSGGHFDLAIWRLADPVLRPFLAEPAARVDPQWSPDGRAVAYLSTGGLWIAGVTGRNARPAVVPGLGASVHGARWAPDSRSLLFVTDLHGNWDIGVYSLSEERWRLVTSESLEEMEADFSSDGRKVAFVSTQGFDKRVGVLTLATGEVDYITPADSVSVSPRWSPIGERLVYVLSDPRQPRQLWEFSEGRTRGLTRSASGHPVDFVAPEAHEYQSREGFLVPSLLYKPANIAPGERHPAIVVVHGSFEGQWIHDFDMLAQYLLTKGFVLFLPNPRGSGGYGRAYERLNDGDWGGGDTDDLLRGREYLARLPYVDGTRIGAWGGSYGGYLTYTLVSQAPEMFQAAAVRAGISDLRWQVVERRGSPARLNSPLSGYPKELGGLPDENPEFYRDRSPITWVRRVKTPMLILHGLRDSRVAPSQSRLWADALRAQGVPVEHHEYPAEDHSLARTRESRHDVMTRLAAFFQRYLSTSPVRQRDRATGH